jgi:nitrite reductase (NADH) large subunit
MDYVIIGNGVAGTTAAANIRKIDSEGRITVISEESYPFYSRIRLMEYLSGEADERGIIIRKDRWYEDNRIDLLLNSPVKKIDAETKNVTLSSGKAINYDRLLLATGGFSFIPPIGGVGEKGVFVLRTLNDAINIRKYAEPFNKEVVLVGGGVLGLEAGNGLRKAGNSITVIEFFPRLLPRQMDPEGAEILKAQMEKMGFKFYLGAKTQEILGNGDVRAVLLEDGTRIDCDMLIISAGVRPNDRLARDIGLEIDKGVIVNDRMETGIPDIYAAGDLTQHNGIFYGIWPAAEKQGQIAGINMAGGSAEYTGTIISNMLKVVGIDLVAAGNIDAERQKESVIVKDTDNYIYKKLVIEENKITGTILYGDISDRRKILNAIDSRTDISGIRKDLEQWDLEKL